MRTFRCVNKKIVIKKCNGILLTAVFFILGCLLASMITAVALFYSKVMNLDNSFLASFACFALVFFPVSFCVVCMTNPGHVSSSATSSTAAHDTNFASSTNVGGAHNTSSARNTRFHQDKNVTRVAPPSYEESQLAVPSAPNLTLPNYDSRFPQQCSFYYPDGCYYVGDVQRPIFVVDGHTRVPGLPLVPNAPFAEPSLSSYYVDARSLK